MATIINNNDKLLANTDFIKKQEMEEIKEWLSDNDYKINKHTLGELKDNDPEWTDYLVQRKVKIARYSELEESLK